MIKPVHPEITTGTVRERMPGLKCPACGYAADGATSVNDGPVITRAKPGDFCLCYRCGSVNRYLEAPTSPSGLVIRQVSPQEWSELQRDPRLSRLLAILANARTEVLKRSKP
jgi:hypothetical protein